MELCIDTATRWASVALAREGVILRGVAWYSKQNHTVELAPAVDYLLHSVHATVGDIKAIVLAGGPGNFSALRVGAGYAKGLALARDLPLVAVGTLEVEAYPYLALDRPVCPVLDAGRGEVAWAVYAGGPEELCQVVKAQVSSVEEMLGQAPAEAVLCGEGVERVAEAPAGRLALRQPPPTRSPSALACLGYRRLSEGRTEDVATFQPRYLRRPSITRPRAPRRVQW